MLTINELKRLVKEAIESVNGESCVTDIGVKIGDDMKNISHDDMKAIEEEYDILFTSIGNQILIKIYGNNSN